MKFSENLLIISSEAERMAAGAEERAEVEA
jgi:hypothetical protein